MKNIIKLLTVLIILSCSSSDDSNEDPNNASTFSVTVTANDTAVIDEVVQVTISTNETMKSLEVSLDNFTTSATQFFDLGTSTLRYVSFDKLGVNTVYFKITNNNGEETIKTANIIISRGNAVKISRVEIVSFFDINK